MALTFKVNGVDQPLPRYQSPYETEYMGFGTQFRTADATLKTQFIAHKQRTHIYWVGLTTTERVIVLNGFVALTSGAVTVLFPDSSSISAYGVLGSWSERVWYSPHTDQPYYDVSYIVEQA